MGLLPVRAVGCSPEMEEVGFEGALGGDLEGEETGSQPHGGAVRATEKIKMAVSRPALANKECG